MTTQPVEIGPENSGMNRRGFLKAFALLTAAAATGGGAALVLRKPGETIITTADATIPTLLPPTAANVGASLGAPALGNSDLTTRLTASLAENLQLQADLATAQRRLADLEAANGSSSQELEALRGQLTESNDRAGLLGGLIALYEQLDEIDLDGVVQNGISSVSQAVDDLLGQVPTLEEGVALGSQALDALEAEIPLVQAGRDWAENRAALLSVYYEDAREILATALDRAGDFLEMLAQWFQDVLKWLPFGMGDRAAQVVEALSSLLQQTPGTAEGLRSYVTQPLYAWVAGEGDDLALRRKLVKPLREQTLTPASEVALKARSTQQTYVTALSQPVQDSALRRQAVRDLIVQYREHYQV
jgi:hypothetical protein